MKNHYLFLAFTVLLCSCTYIGNLSIPSVPDFPYDQSARVKKDIAELNKERCTRGDYIGKHISSIKTDAGKRFEKQTPDGKGKFYAEYMDYTEFKDTLGGKVLGDHYLHGITITYYTTEDGKVSSCVAKQQLLRPSDY